MHAIARRLRISAKKANLVAGLVRKKSVQEALNILQFTPKKGAQMLYKVVKSAASNAENNFKQRIEQLFIEEIIVGQGSTYKRSLPVSRGRSHPIRKPTAHIHVRVGVKADLKKEEKETVKKEPKPKAKKTIPETPVT